MLRRTPDLDALERRYTRDCLGPLTYSQALEIYAAMWREAASLGADAHTNWEDDIAPDLELARVLNTLNGP